MEKDDILELISNNRLDEAQAQSEAALARAADDSERACATYLLGRVAWKRGLKARAISLYADAAALDPAGDAVVALEQAREIMGFFNKDLYNP